MAKFNRLEWTLLALASIMVGGCYAWVERQEVNQALIHKIETPLAQDFCTKLLGGMKRGCAVRLTNTENGITRCVAVVLPGDLEAVRHEASHCMGQDH